ncbi:MAG: hypothetical protein ACREOP_13185 [Thermodesulfobacteriota bacterium]
MISKRIYAFILLPVLLVLIYGGCGGSGGNNPQPTPKPTPQPTPQPGACNSLSLNTPYITDDNEEFYSFTQTGSTLDTKVFSNGSTVFVIVNDGSTIFGFRGVPGGGGTSCAMFSASADYNMDGTFDETAASFGSACMRLQNGAEFTFIDGPSEVDASQEFENGMLVLYNQVQFFNVSDPIVCESIDPVAGSGIYESLLSQLEAQGNAL